MGQYCSLPLMDVFSQRPDRYRTLEEGLSMAPAGADSRLFEIACGDGRAAMWFADKFGAGATGVDISEKRIAAARTMAAGSGADPAPEFICADFFSLPADEKYTHIYCEDFFSSLDEEHKRRFAGRQNVGATLPRPAMSKFPARTRAPHPSGDNSAGHRPV